MSKSLHSLIAALLLSAAAQAVAASSVDLSVRGLITPSACEPTLANDGVVELGKISVQDLRLDWPTYLPRQDMQMTVTCDAATLIAIAATDNREGSDAQYDYYTFGLGMINGSEKLGFLTISTSNLIADGMPVRAIGSRDGGVTWQREGSFMDDGLTAVSELDTLTPLPVQRLTADLQIKAAIAPAQDLTFTKEETIDGSVTLTVKYL
ncbi:MULTISPECIES: DUF1120 domain-containing protein [unclassified Pseudomonas]|uniref:DUF1120 domain-containing protein n=1 Tax=unclassified Pseudomonas TaxID=196821 RepID=UPI0030D766FF